MLVSAISAKNNTILNTRVNSRGGDGYTEVALSFLNSSSQSSNNKQNKIYDSINEWKTFCHKQIEKGKFDVIA